MRAFGHRHVRILCLLAAILAAAQTGCPNTSNSPLGGAAAKVKTPLTLLVVDDPQLGQAIAREWRGRTEEEVTVQEATAAQLVSAKRLPGDVVIFPSGMVGQLIEQGLMVPLESTALEEAQFDYRDIFDQIRLQEMKWGNRTVAAPLGSPQLLLVYRADLFEKLGLKPPSDWTEYQQAIVKLADRAALGELAPPAEQPWRATIEPLVDGWAGQLLLARAAAYALHRDQISPLFRYDSLTPLIDQPPYVRALEELIAAAKAGGFADQALTPAEAFAELRGGRCAMALTWPAPAATKKTTDQEQKLGFALLPGGRQGYRFATKMWEDRGPEDDPHVPLLATFGRMAAVTSSSADPKRAQGFVVWLSSREASSQVGPHSAATTLFRKSQMAGAGRWTGGLSDDAARQYAEVLSQSLSLPRAFPGLRLPGRLDYLATLDKAVRQAVSGEKPAAEALAEAAKRWQEISDKLGLKEQRRANARSLGQEPL